MAGRPYIKLKYYELQEIAEANRHDLQVCEELLFELSFRSTKGALALSEEVQERVNSLKGIRRPFLYKLLAEKDLLTCEDLSKQIDTPSHSWDRSYIAAATGWSPFSSKTIRSLAFWDGAILGGRDIWQEGQFIVVGREGFDEDYLRRAAELASEKDLAIEFLSQEDFLNFVLNDVCPDYGPSDPRITGHPGLSFLSSIGFKWPAVGIYTGKNLLENFEGEDHDLATRYSYSVRKGVSVAERKRALNQGVQGLGLKVVAHHIAGLARRNSGNAKMKDAVSCWKADLEWLYETKYLGSAHGFFWPSIH